MVTLKDKGNFQSTPRDPIIEAAARALEDCWNNNRPTGGEALPLSTGAAMTMHEPDDDADRPDVVRRTCGGFLAIAPTGSRFSIAVTAPTAEEAREKFRVTFNRWAEIRALKPEASE